MQDEYVQGSGGQRQGSTSTQECGRQMHRVRGTRLPLSMCSGGSNPVRQANRNRRLLGTSYRKCPSDRCNALCHGRTARAVGKMLRKSIPHPFVEVRAEGLTHQLFGVAASHV